MVVPGVAPADVAAGAERSHELHHLHTFWLNTPVGDHAMPRVSATTVQVCSKIQVGLPAEAARIALEAKPSTFT